MFNFRNVLALRGPSVWANFPVLEAWVELGDWDRPSTTFPGFVERLKAMLPSMIEHRCGLGYRGGFFERLDGGTYLGHILEHVTLELQTMAGSDGGYGRARETAEPGVYKVVVRYRDETLGRECLETARQLILAAIEDRPFDVDATVERLRAIANKNLLGPSAYAIVDAARLRNIPFIRLDEWNLVQLGYGAQQRRFRAVETDRTGAVAESIARDKQTTRKLLQAVGVPTAVGFPVESAADAWETADDWVGFPCVVKPRFGNAGRGVSLKLNTREEIVSAYEKARTVSDEVVLERWIEGDDYRLLVVGGRVVAAARRVPAQVAGDGQRTVRELIEIENRDPRRLGGPKGVLSRIEIDENILAPLDAVPAEGERVLLRAVASLQTGGTAVDVTDAVHPDIAARAVEAASAVGLDIAGVDVIARDISVPLEEQGGVVCDVNASPGLRMHLAPSEGERRDVADAIVQHLFPNGANGRIPIVAITGTNGKTTVARFIAHILHGTGQRVALTCSDGIHVGARRIQTGDCSGPGSARSVLLNPHVDIAVFETARGGIVRAGLAFNECRVAVVTNIGQGDHLGIADINDPEQLAKVKRTIVDVVAKETGTAVLNAADPLVAGMAQFCKGRVLFFDRDGENPVIAQHRENGGAAIFTRDGQVILAEGANERAIMPLDRIPLTQGGRIGFEVENALASIGAAWAAGASEDVIVREAETFSSDLSQSPARFNVFELRGATVIVDYGHNPDALRAMVDALNAFPNERRAALFSASGDRRDEDIIQMGRMLGDAFDRVILYEDTDLYKRAPGDIIALMRRGLAEGARVKEIEELQGGLHGLQYALDTVRPGELLLAQAHLANPTAAFLREYLGNL